MSSPRKLPRPAKLVLVAIDQQTARNLEEELRTILREVGMGWIVEQVDETLAEGRYVVKPRRRGGRDMETGPIEVVEKASDTRRGEIGTRPFTPYERLQVLTDAATAAVAQEPELEEEIEQEVIDKDPAIEAVEFVDEDTSTVTRLLGRDEPAEGRRVRAGRAVEALSEFRRYITEDM